MTWEDYPYNSLYARRGPSCLFDAKKATSCQVDSYSFAEVGDIDMMRKALTH